MKTTVYFTAFLIIFVWTSCRDCTTHRNFERLQGEWQTLIEDESWEGYIFKEDSSCIYKPGYFVCEYEESHPANEAFFYHFERNISYIHCFLDSETKYRLKGNILSIYNPESGDWEGYTFRFLGRDTLFLSDAEYEKKFIKKHFEPDTLPLFDRVVLYMNFLGLSDHDYFEKSISLRCSGEMIYYKMCDEPVEFSGVRATLSPGDFEFIEGMFKGKTLRSYLDNPPAREIRRERWDEHFSITFIKGDKMITIENPWLEIRTRSFCWAYLTALFADERDQTIEDFDLNDMGLLIREFSFYNRCDSILSWYNSEKFYLFTLLYHAEETDRDFEPQYILESYQPLPEGQGKKVLIETDGRYYRYKRWDRPVTLDIGFNFIERYQLENQFKTDPYLEYR